MPRNYGATIVTSNFSIYRFPAKPCASPIISPKLRLRRAPLMRGDDGIMQLKALRDWLGWFPYLRKKLLSAAIADAPEEDVVGESWQLLSSPRNVHFNEMEFHLPPDRALEALKRCARILNVIAAMCFSRLNAA